MSTELIGSGLVLEAPEHGPQFCLGVIGLSWPPVGFGPGISNWDWAAVSGYESGQRCIWGDYVLVGTLSDGVFTMTRPAMDPGLFPDRSGQTPEVEDRLSTPCPPPPGGWGVIDPDLTSEESLTETTDIAEHLPGFARLWVDQSINAAMGKSRQEAEHEWNDPRKLILNVAVVGDARHAEATLRQTWGGPLCVSSVAHTEVELRAVRDQVVQALDEREGVECLTAGKRTDHVYVLVEYDDGSLQREMDQLYPAGLVKIGSALQPYVPDGG